jgi:hypothetical protein
MGIYRMIRVFCDSCYDYVTGEKLEHCKSLNHDFTEERVQNTDSDKLFLQFVKDKIHKSVIDQSDNSKLFVTVVMRENVYENMDIESKSFRDYVTYSFYKEHEKILTQDAVERLLNIIRVEAIYNESTPHEQTYLRCATSDKRICYDLANSKRTVVLIENDSISVTNNTLTEDLPIFLRTKTMSEVPEPIYDETNRLDEFCGLLRMGDDLVFRVHLISLFLSHIVIPIMIIVGQEGSAKSSKTALVKMLIDPSGSKIKDPLTYFPKSVDDILNIMANRYLVAYDNVSYISPDQSDALCVATTGGGQSKRKLYTDNDESNVSYQRKIIGNGITITPESGDLTRRSISYFTDRIPDTERLTVESVLGWFKTIQAELLGEIFTILKNAMKILPEVREDTLAIPDMADFTIWGEAISRAMGNEKGKFVEEYNQKLISNSEILNENNPAVAFFLEELGEKPELELPVSMWYVKLESFADTNGIDKRSRNYPKNSNKIRGWLERSKPILFKAGLEVEIYPSSGSKFKKNNTILKVKKVGTL